MGAVPGLAVALAVPDTAVPCFNDQLAYGSMRAMRAYAAAHSTLLMTQKPQLQRSGRRQKWCAGTAPRTPAWWPGGRDATNATRAPAALCLSRIPV